MESPERDSRKRLGSPPRGSNKRLKRHEDDVDGVRISREYPAGRPFSPPRRSQRSSTSFYASQDGREFGKWDIEQPTNHVQRGYVSTYNGHGHGRRPNRGGHSRGRAFEDVGLGPCVEVTEVEYGSPKQNACTVHVSNMLYSWDVAKLVQHMAQCGKVAGARLVVKDGRVTGKAFVTFHSTACAERAVSTLAGTMVDGRELMVAHWCKDVREMTASDHDVGHQPAGPASVASMPAHGKAPGASRASDDMAIDPPCVAADATPEAAAEAPKPTSASAKDTLSAVSLPADAISQSEGVRKPDTLSEPGAVEPTQDEGETSKSQSKDAFAPNEGGCDAASAAEQKEVAPVAEVAQQKKPESVPEQSSKRGGARNRSRSGKARSVGRGAEGNDATKVESPVANGVLPAELAQVSPKGGQRRARPKKKATTKTKRSESQASPQRKATVEECNELSLPAKASPLKGQRTLDSFMSRSCKTIAMLRVKEIHDAPEVCMLDPLHVSGAFSPPKPARKRKKPRKDTDDMQVEGHDEGQAPSKSTVDGVEKQSKSSARRKQKAKPEEISKALEKKAKNRAPAKRDGKQTSAKKAKKSTTAAATKTSEQKSSLRKAGKKKESGKKRQPRKSAVEKEPREDIDGMVVEEEHEGAPLDDTLSVPGSGDEEYVPPTKKEEKPKKAKRKRKDGEGNKLRFASAKAKPEPEPDPEPEQKHFTKVITLGDALDMDLCEACGCAGKLLVRCTVCASPFHRYCLDLRCDTEQLIENWRCPDCKVCEVCNDPGQGEKMVVCDICDGGFHIFCLKAPLPTIPDRAWLCEDCGMCIGCGEMTHHVPDRSVLKDLTYNPPPKDRVTPVCPSCEVKFGLKYFCHMCNRTYAYDDSDVEMVCCSKCDEWVHNTCDNITDEEYEMLGGDNYSYFCPECRERDDSLQRITHESEEGVKAKKVFEQAGFFRLMDVAEESPQSEKKTKKTSGPQSGNKTAADRDPRQCELCRLGGDREESLETCLQRTDLAMSQIEGRLIPIGVDQWVHVQCALWSSEVEIDDRGMLQRARSAVRRNLSMRCEFCKEKGGTMGCWVESCKNTFHFSCALKARCLLGLETRALYCKKHAKHKKKPDDVFVIPCESQFEEFHSSLQTTAQSFLVNQNPKYPKERFKLRVGSYTLVATGQINVAPGYHSAKFIYPVGFSGIRRFWSMKNPTETTDYRCTILLGPVFCIEPLDAKNTASECIYASTPTEAWAEVTSAIDKTQTNASLRISGLKSGEFLFGLGLPWVMDILEELPGADECISYQFQRGRRGNGAHSGYLAENPSGCARCEPFQKTSIQKRITSRAPRVTDADDTRYQSPVVESGIKNRDLLTASFGSSRAELSARFGYYLRTPRKVRIGKSHIHSFGLFAKAHIVPNEIILEYTGETIRQIIADLREKENELRGVDCYLFRIDDDCIIDATWKGNLARFANHSCGPNAAARNIIYDGSPRIVLIAMDYIRPGEEITYDYKFSFEEGEEKVPCLCGAPNCRGSMN